MTTPGEPPALLSSGIAGRSFQPRAIAWIIDLAIIWTSTVAMSLLGGASLAVVLLVFGGELNIDDSRAGPLNLLASLAITATYGTVFEALYGATPGKLIRRMRVVRLDGTSCGLGAALLRGILRAVDGLVFGLPAYLSMQPPHFQRIGDKLAGTVVAASEDQGIAPPPAWWWFAIASIAYLAISSVIVLLAVIASLRAA